jgi:dihydroflavonol-4-reductase
MTSLRWIEDLRCERLHGDLRDAASLKEALRGVTEVFHVAADYRFSAKDPKEIYDNNVTGTRNLLGAARDAGVERFVHTSTGGIFAVDRGGALPNEDTKVWVNEMIGHYKKSKLLAEEEVLNAAASGFPAVVVNPTTPVGPADWKPTPTGRMIVDFLNGRMPAYIETGLNLLAVEDAAQGHLLAAERGQIGQRYILGCRNMTLKEVLQSLAAVTGRPAPWIRLPHTFALAAAHAENLFANLLHREPRIPLEGVRMARHKMFVDTSRAVRELGFHPGSVEAALERAVRWYEANGYVTSARYSPQALRRQTL